VTRDRLLRHPLALPQRDLENDVQPDDEGELPHVRRQWRLDLERQHGEILGAASGHGESLSRHTLRLTMPEQRYISNELSHFVGRGKKTPEEQYEVLLKILREEWVTHPPHDPSAPSGGLTISPTARISTNEMYLPEVVCFCDIPPADIGLHVTKYSPFGLSFPKRFIAALGGAPVFYIPIDEPARDLTVRAGRGAHFDRMLREFHALLEDTGQGLKDDAKTKRGVTPEYQRFWDVRLFLEFHVFAFVKAFQNRLPDEHPDNFYLEREWRIVGNVKFSMTDVERVFLPRAFAERFRKHVPGYHGQLTFVD